MFLYLTIYNGSQCVRLFQNLFLQWGILFFFYIVGPKRQSYINIVPLTIDLYIEKKMSRFLCFNREELIYNFRLCPLHSINSQYLYSSIPRSDDLGQQERGDSWVDFASARVFHWGRPLQKFLNKFTLYIFNLRISA